MNITIGKYTLQVILSFCFILCWFLLMAGWYALGLPQIFSVLGSSLIIVGIVKLIERKFPKLRKDFPIDVKLGGLKIHLIGLEPQWTPHRKFYSVMAFSIWLLLMLGAIVFGAAWLGDSTIWLSVLASVVALVLLVNHIEKRWRA